MASVGEGAYEGPPLTIDSSGPQHRAVLTAPSSGWTVTLDQTRARFDHIDAFITVTRPDPAYMQTQALVKQEVGSMVDRKTAMDLYARVLEFGEKPGSQVYRLAGHVGGDRPAPAPAPAKPPSH
jgi:hypothetical protein